MSKIKKVVYDILKYEKKNSLFALQFKRLPVWAYYRMYFYYAFTKDINILDTSNSRIKISLQYVLKIMNIFNIVKLLRKSDYLILEHPRSNKDKKDIYTDEVVNLIGREKCAIYTFSENGNIFKHDDVVYLDIIKIISKMVSKMSYRVVRDKYFKSNFKDFLKDLNIDGSKYIKYYKRYYVELIVQYYFYHFLLKAIGVKKVVLVVSYYNMPLVFAAKNLKIEVIEMQHGVISKYHLGYHFPYFEGDFFPDVLITFSGYWKNAATYPGNTDIVALGNTYMSSTYKNIVKKKHTILVISQTTIGKKLERLILNNIDDLSCYEIYFKLHPSEFNDKDTKYKLLNKFSNVNLVTNQKSIEELQLFCEYQIGIYSTAIYEGIEKQCKTILLNDTGVEYMDHLVQENIVQLVEYEDKINDILGSIEKVKEVCFFDSFDNIKAKDLFCE